MNHPHINGTNGALKPNLPANAEDRELQSKAKAVLRTLYYLFHDQIAGMFLEGDYERYQAGITFYDESTERLTVSITRNNHTVYGIQKMWPTEAERVQSHIDIALNGYSFQLIPGPMSSDSISVADERDCFVAKTRPLEFIPGSPTTFDQD